jgi:hypothetical protein
LHNPPGFHLHDSLCTKPLESLNFRVDVIGFDIEVHATWVINALYLDVQTAWPGIEPSVVVLTGTIQTQCPVAKRLPPELSSNIEVAALTIDDQAPQLATMH